MLVAPSFLACVPSIIPNTINCLACAFCMTTCTCAHAFLEFLTCMASFFSVLANLCPGVRNSRPRPHRMPTLLVLVGIPGSGKTTVAQQLCASSSAWEWVNQDTLGDRRRCEDVACRALSHGRNVIVDRCNTTDQQREAWTRLADDVRGPRVQTVALQLLLPLELCIERVRQRSGHPTLAPAQAEEVCTRFFHDFMVVQRHERFDQLLTVHHPDELQGVLQQLQDLVQPIAALGSHADRQTGCGQDGRWSQADSAMADRYADSRSHFGGGVDRQRNDGLGRYSDRREGYGAEVVDRHAGTLDGHRGGMSDRHHGGMSDRHAADWYEADRPHLERSSRHGDRWDRDASGSGRRDSAGPWDREGTRSRRSSHSDQAHGGGHVHSTEGTRYAEEVHAHAQAGSGGSTEQQRQRGFEVQAKHGRSADEQADLPPWQPHRKRSRWDSSDVGGSEQPQQPHHHFQHPQHQRQHQPQHPPSLPWQYPHHQHRQHYHSEFDGLQPHPHVLDLPHTPQLHLDPWHGSLPMPPGAAVSAAQLWQGQGGFGADLTGRGHERPTPPSDAPWLASTTRDGLEGQAWGAGAQGLLQGPGSASGRGGRGGGWGGGGRGGRAGRPGRGERDAMVAQLLKKYADPDCKVPYDELPAAQPDDSAPPSATMAPTAAATPAAEAAGDASDPVTETGAEAATAASASPAAVSTSVPGSDPPASSPVFAPDSAPATTPSAAVPTSAPASASPAAAPATAPPAAVPAALPAAGLDHRVILLFDLNGTLTSHTASRYSSGVNRARPGVQGLLQLRPAFRLGVFTSATVRTVETAVTMLEQEAGVGPGELFEYGLVLHRDHTQRLEDGAKHWDTCKPLSRWFSRLHRVVLFDDDAHKARPEEQRNLVKVPCWDDRDTVDAVLEELVEAVKEVFGALGEEGDVREATEKVSQRLERRAEQTKQTSEERERED